MNGWRALRTYWRMLWAPDEPVRDDDFPPALRWWSAPSRSPSPEEKRRRCPQCAQPLGESRVRQCPGCGELFHLSCYDDTEGGRAYATPGCEACRMRTHWR